MAEQRDYKVVRVTLGANRVAPQSDPLGRSRIGYDPHLDTSELWERGRGLWRARLAKVAEAELLLIAFADTVVMVGTVTGVTRHDGRIAITGHPDPSHPLIGRPDPLSNSSANPVAYGTLETVPAARAAQRPVADVLALAVSALTEAGRMHRPRIHQAPAGQRETRPTETDPADWAEFVVLALAGAAANLGGIDQALAGRAGSRETAKLKDLLHSVTRTDKELRHRTEPVGIGADVAELLTERTEAGIV